MNPADSQLRIIGGNWRGRKISFTSFAEIRPTPDRIRETLFAWLQPDIHGSHCLDLYSGSGILGVEALSRGAAHVTLVEKSRKTCDQLAATMRSLDVSSEYFTIVNNSADAFLSTADGARQDIIFVDPPFDSTELQTIQPLIPRVLTAGGYVYVESGDQQPAHFAGLNRYRNKKAGKVSYALYC
jgi:16S rRNA (guanine966-N2)-methyltransferase